MDKKPPFLFYGSLISLAALAILFAVRLYRPLLLDIESKWLVIAGLPVLIALIAGKYISKFKGFGIDIEVAAEQELIDNPTILTILHRANVKRKGDEDELYHMSENNRIEYNVLSFELGRTDYYNKDVVRRYVEELPNVTFFEITLNGKFAALMKIDRPRFTNHNNMREIEWFIEMIEMGNLGYFEAIAATRFVYNTTTIVNTLEAIRSSGTNFIGVLDSLSRTNLIGIAFERTLEKYLASAVLKSYKGR